MCSRVPRAEWVVSFCAAAARALNGSSATFATLAATRRAPAGQGAVHAADAVHLGNILKAAVWMPQRAWHVNPPMSRVPRAILTRSYFKSTPRLAAQNTVRLHVQHPSTRRL